MNGRKFTKKEDSLLRNKALSHTQVARLTGRTAATIYGRRKALNITECKGKRQEWKASDLDQLVKPKRPISEIAKDIGRSYTATYFMYRQLNDHL